MTVKNLEKRLDKLANFAMNNLYQLLYDAMERVETLTEMMEAFVDAHTVAKAADFNQFKTGKPEALGTKIERLEKLMAQINGGNPLEESD